MSFFETGLYASLLIAALGLAWRVCGWLRNRTKARPESGQAKGNALRALLLDILLLGRTRGQSIWRWLAHCLILAGFIYLLLFHAMASLVSANLVDEYYPTLDPWQFLRNLAGIMVLMGCALFLVRRLKNARLRRLSRLPDWAFLALVGCIVLSGFGLEASKMISPAVFDRMVVDYLGSEDQEEILALKAHWAREFGAVFSETLPGDDGALQLGAELSDQSCNSCHANTSSAFASRGLAGLMAPLAPALARQQADQALYYIHIALCFLGLAALPWGKFLHPLSTPLNLLMRRTRRDSAAPSAPHGMGLAACTHCGECSLHCSVAPFHTVLGNADILPSEKLRSLQRWQSGQMNPADLARFAQGSRICSECLRCTELCPSGIDLQALWLESKPKLPGPHKAIWEKIAHEWAAFFDGVHYADMPLGEGMAQKSETFWACVQCTTCTSVCPVVAASQETGSRLDATPQQVMNLLRMGLVGQAMATGMAWACATCYQCQEHCPQDIPVTDILFELRSLAAIRLERASLEEAR